MSPERGTAEAAVRAPQAFDDQTVHTVRIEELLPADSPRLAGEDLEHARALADVETPLPPILVHRPTMRVIDGMHRLRAAVMRGHETIEARFFEGPEQAAFLLAVRENIAHGLPLTSADREAAALRILRAHPDWSDRAVALAAGVSTRRVALVRGRSTDAVRQSNARVGRDGRLRPLDGAAGRLRASEIVRTRPDASLREIAREAGISVATARDVRERLRLGEDPLPPRQRADAGAGAGPGAATGARPGTGLGAGGEAAAAVAPRPARPTDWPVEWPVMRQKLRQDPALRYAQSGRAFLQWLDSRVISGEELRGIVESVPAHWVDEIAALALVCAEHWRELARELEDRRQATA
ncbi:ParB/RepB/Spo0J family partition protein [Actinomadura rupiterrae]|uniref:ParB/RepB/Spo0J family partition protein n=1 Tax=Actinomadura rupiterrae TaxID=559627 RepID=UPI0020A5F672|nr:ParB/RepB/Spo0J family partition protein [Actinomadura rupiterrae]MCP2341711.1 ParB-like chromosome segregation protein Spo0J [Actinomadura rupiterrae]